LIAAVQHGVSKNPAKPYSMVTLEDLEGSVQFLVHERELRQVPPLLEVNKAILVIGEVNTGEDKPKIFPQEIMPLEDAPKKFTKQVHLRLHTAHLKPEHWKRARTRRRASGQMPVAALFHAARRREGFHGHERAVSASRRR
jgi:DNA polymerase III alpha subunit